MGDLKATIARGLAAAGVDADRASGLARDFTAEVAATELADRAAPVVAAWFEHASAATRARFAEDPAHRAALIVLAGTSEVAGDWLRLDPALLTAAAAGIPDRTALDAALAAVLGEVAPGDVDAEAAAIATVQKHALLAIMAADPLGEGPLEVVCRALSTLADAATAAALGRATMRLQSRYPELRAAPLPFTILALGKHGAEELNYSSDIDLVFIHDDAFVVNPEAAVDRVTLFARLGSYVVELLGRSTPAGPLYRVDMRLRPHGARGALCPGLRAALRYYEEEGRTWERQALLKARAIAGDLALGERLLASLHSFVYRRYFRANAIADVKGLKRRIEQRAASQPVRDVKVGEGGIRDLEFTVQFLQLIHGAELPEVRVRDTLTALRRLAGAGCLDMDDERPMRAAYEFLRTVEHRLMTLRLQQVHALPTDDAGILDVARRMGFRGTDASARFLRTLDRHGDVARGILERLVHRVFPEPPAGPAAEATDLVLDPEPTAERKERVLGGLGFADAERAYRTLERLGRDKSRFFDFSPRARRALASVAPRLLRRLAEAPDPLAALTGFERIATSLGGKVVLYQLLEDAPDALELFCRLAESASFLNDLLVRNPGLADEVLDLLVTREPVTVSAVSARLAAADPGATDGKSDPGAVVAIQRSTLLLVGLKDLGGRSNLSNVQHELTALAEAVLQHLTAAEMARAGLAHEPKVGLSLLGLGKLGGRELGYGSDLDVIAVLIGGKNEAERAAAMVALSRVGQRVKRACEDAGLYEIDHRLRPGDRNASLVTSERALLAHYRSPRAETWERLAATKLRPVAGDLEQGARLVEAIHTAIYAEPPAELREKTLAMRARLEAAREGRYDLKRMRGGLLDLEFVTAYLRLLHRGEPRAIRTPGVVSALHALTAAGHLPAAAYSDLLTGYQHLRKLEAELRLETGRATSKLPTHEAALDRIARGVGYVDTRRHPARESMLAELTHHTEAIRRRFEQLIASGGQPLPRHP